MEDAGTLPTNTPERRFDLGAHSPVADPLAEIPTAVAPSLKECAQAPADSLPSTYGDPGGLWVTVRRQNPFDVLLLDQEGEPSPEAVLARYRLLSRFWSHKLTVSRQGASRAVMQKKYGDAIDSYVDNVHWAYDQLTAHNGAQFWRLRIKKQRAESAWMRVSDAVDATLADGVLDPPEITWLMTRAEAAGYEREEFAVALRDVLHARRFEPERPPTGTTESGRLVSVRWATAEVWSRHHEKPAQPTEVVPSELYYVKMRSGAVVGPIRAEAVTEIVRTNRGGVPESVCVVGASQWEPVTRSRFAPTGYHCPSCGSVLVAYQKQSVAGWVLFILGIVTLAIVIGIPLIIIGLVMIWNGRNDMAWRCTRCGFST